MPRKHPNAAPKGRRPKAPPAPPKPKVYDSRASALAASERRTDPLRQRTPAPTTVPLTFRPEFLAAMRKQRAPTIDEPADPTAPLDSLTKARETNAWGEGLVLGLMVGIIGSAAVGLVMWLIGGAWGA